MFPVKELLNILSYIFISIQAFNKDISILSETVIPYILPRHLVQDIDSPEDWIRAEIMHQVIQKINRKI